MNGTGKMVVFVAGIAVGAIASVMAFYSIFYSPDAGKNKTSDPVNAEKPDVPVAATTEIKKNEAETRETLSLKTVPIAVADGTKDYYPNIDSNSKLYDSLVAANGNLNFELTGGNEIVKSEKLLKVKKLKLIRRISSTEKSAADSLLSAVSVKNESFPAHYDIEFWQTPLNSRGYRSGKNKLALYGVDPEASLYLYLLEEGLFLKNDKTVYKIERTPEFRNFKQVNSKEILEQVED